jgi:hypothetical protein
MNRTTYRRTTNFCFVVAAASVILFDRFPQLHWLTGGCLIASGVAAAAVHFYVQWRPVQTEKEAATEESLDAVFTPVEAPAEPVPVEGRQWFAEVGGFDPGVAFRPMLMKFALDYPPRPPIDASGVAVLCQKLAATETDFEVTITGEGNLTIRPIRQKQREQRGFENLERLFTKGSAGPSALIH